MVITSDEYMPISQLVGYMLKVIKSGRHIPQQYTDRFNAIKHGDYDCFFDYIKEPQHDFMAQSKSGVIKTDDFSQKGGDSDFALLHKIEPSIKKFFADCSNYYGEHIDNDISNLTYCKCAAFEIAMRAQKNKERQNRNLPYTNLTLEKTIDEISICYNIPNSEKELLQNGRRFVNMIKGHKAHFAWQEGIIAFDKAWEICNKYQLKLCR